MPTLYDAARCPYCARVRIVLAVKDVAYDPVEIDLDDRPASLYDLNETGRVPVLERFDRFADAYSDCLRSRPGGSSERVAEELARRDEMLQGRPYLAGSAYGLADIGFVPWVLRAETRLGPDVRSHGALAEWLDRLGHRPAVAAEGDLLARAA